jgi:hypothetical protein
MNNKNTENIIKIHNLEHKYKIGNTLWIRPDTMQGLSSFQAVVKKLCFDEYKRPAYLCSINTYEVFGSFEMDNKPNVLLLSEIEVLADYNNKEQMKKYNGC